MASHYHHHYQHPSANPTTSHCHCFYAPPPPYPPPCHHHHPPPDPHLLYHPPPRFQEPPPQTQHNPTVASLLCRIAALESTLKRRSSSSAHSLRDAAARTIQTHFRALLLRRSRTLRQLKELASIKSTLAVLKASVSSKPHFDYDVVYRAVVDLLLKLNTIQGGDPMIRDGKSSIRRELNRFLDFIDGFCLERRGLSGGGVNVRCERSVVKSRVVNRERKLSNVKFGDAKRVNSEKLRGLVERIDKLAEELAEEEGEEFEEPNFVVRKHGASGNRSGVLLNRHGGVRVQPKVKKSVSFVEDGKVYRVLRRNSDEAIPDDDCDDENGKREVEVIGVSSKEGEEDDDDDDDDVEAHSENGGSLASSDGKKVSRVYLRSENDSDRLDQDEPDSFTFSAPMPLKMETRIEDIRKK